MPIDETKVVADRAYRDLYMKYLGTLRVLGEVAVYANRERAPEVREQIEACMADAAEFLAGRVRVIERLDRIDIEPIDPTEET